MKNKKIMIYAFSILAFIVFFGAVSYAYFVYKKDVINITLETGNMAVNTTGGSNLNLTNIVSMSDEMGKQSSNYVDFTVTGSVDTEALMYEIALESNNSAMNDYLKFYLTNNQNEVIAGPFLYKELYNSDENGRKVIHQDFINKTEEGTLVSKTKNYRLRVWLSGDIPATNGSNTRIDLYVYAKNIVNPEYLYFNMGSGRTITKIIPSDGEYGNLPTPVKDGYIFDGWDDLGNTVIDGYRYDGEKVFSGSVNDYIDTGVYLWSNDNWQRNFYMEFEIKSNESVDTNATLMSAKDESGSPYAGIDFRHSGSLSKYRSKAAKSTTSSLNNDMTNISIDTKKVKFLRIGNVLKYNFTDTNSFQTMLDFSGFEYQFDRPVVFGAGLDESGSPRRPFKGTLKNILVTFLDNDATESDFQDHYLIKEGIVLDAKWNQSIIFNKISTNDLTNISYIQSYDEIISSNPSFETRDTVEINNNKKTVYYYTGSDALTHGNVLFAGFCWQIIRTTDTGGVKLLYNGVADNNQCLTTRSATKGINAVEQNSTLQMNYSRLYGRSYTYNLETGKFNLLDTDGLPSMWNDNTYKELIGTYTCRSDTSTECETLYYVGNYISSTSANVVKYRIGDVNHYSQIGKTSFHANKNNLAYVGYMFNNTYIFDSGLKDGGGTYASDVTWDSTNNHYNISNDTSATLNNGHHYICEDSNCATVRFYYYASNDSYNYILLSNGKKIEDALNEMINNNNDYTSNLNRYDSAIKGLVDNWFAKNLVSYIRYIDEDAVYCNDRSVYNYNGFSKTGDLSQDEGILFRHYISNNDLSCKNITDRFSKNNYYAKLKYPVGLLSSSERNMMSANYAATGQLYYGMSPRNFSIYARLRGTSGDGSTTGIDISNLRGARPVITLKSNNSILAGDGSYANPYQINTSVN